MRGLKLLYNVIVITIIINCNLVVTRWQWLFYPYIQNMKLVNTTLTLILLTWTI